MIDSKARKRQRDALLGTRQAMEVDPTVTGVVLIFPSDDPRYVSREEVMGLRAERADA
jgi:hypothetical protein